MITSTMQYKDLTVIREHMIQCGGTKPEDTREVDTVRVERRLSDRIEIIMPTEPLFSEAVSATAAKLYLAEIGRKGGQKSRRKLTPEQARAMVIARERKKKNQNV
jgi:hypothetical protein